MLVLSRRKEQEVVITVADRQVVIKVTEIGRGKVRLGFDAPLDVKILRRELIDRQEPKKAG